MDELRLDEIRPDREFDGGDLDCGSGLVLLIRENMLGVPHGGILEMRSVEPTVASDLPPWCRMVGHEYLGSLPGSVVGQSRYFVRRGSGEAAAREAATLQQDKERARNYAWRLRARSTGRQKTTVYCRNFQWSVGQPASFEEHDAHPSAVEAALGALAGDLASGFATACSRAGVSVDDIELTVTGKLHDVMAVLALSEGDPSFAAIDVKLFASTFEEEAHVHALWSETVRRSPLAATLAKATAFTAKIAIV
ncbi:MAG: OsmC family protein [Planctomycetes bacterium]|nr:OsmC family protein [Planctomycetota bacterium]MCB9889830.1 OsmC family protein [Planctomycetota bacterium]